MNSLRQTLQIFLPLVVGIGLLAFIPRIPFLVNFEHSAFWSPERHGDLPSYPGHGTKESFEISILAQSAVTVIREDQTYTIDTATEDILGSSPLQPANWAYLLSQLQIDQSKLLVINDELSWEGAEEIPIRALQHELSRFPASVVGLSAEKTGEASPIPPYLESSIIGAYQGFPKDLPEIDHIPHPPSITPTYFGISTIRGIKDDPAYCPLLIKWGNHLLPSLELAALLAEFQIPPSELIIDPAGYIRRDREGPLFLEIDSQGRVSCSHQGSSLSASELFTSEKEPTSHYFFTGADRSENLAVRYSHLARWGQTKTATYTRWPLIIEVSLLIIVTLSFYTKRLWPALILIAAAYPTSLFFSKWLLISPLLVLLIAYFLLFRRRGAPERKDRKKPPSDQKEHRPA